MMIAIMFFNHQEVDAHVTTKKYQPVAVRHVLIIGIISKIVAYSPHKLRASMIA